jgi:hypothetical protein
MASRMEAQAASEQRTNNSLSSVINSKSNNSETKIRRQIFLRKQNLLSLNTRNQIPFINFFNFIPNIFIFYFISQIVILC